MGQTYEPKDADLKNYLCESLEMFGPLKESEIDDLIALGHFKGKIDAGEIKEVQGMPYSRKWRWEMHDLVENDEVSSQGSPPGREFSISEERNNETNEYKGFLRSIKSMSSRERFHTAREMYYREKNIDPQKFNVEVVHP